MTSVISHTQLQDGWEERRQFPMFARPPSLSHLALEFSLPLLLPTPPWPSLCLSLSVCFLSSYYPIWPASHYKPIRRDLQHHQPPAASSLSSLLILLQPARGGAWQVGQQGSRQHLVKTETLFGPKYRMPDGEAEPGHDLGLLIRKQAIFINWSNKH